MWHGEAVRRISPRTLLTIAANENSNNNKDDDEELHDLTTTLTGAKSKLFPASVDHRR
jgi:hypothetical protein